MIINNMNTTAKLILSFFCGVVTASVILIYSNIEDSSDLATTLTTILTTTLTTPTKVTSEQESVTKEIKFKYDISHLSQTTQVVWGPIQDDEALLLFGLVKSIRPKIVVEFGFSHGASAFNFLKALDFDAKMYSFDIHLYDPKAKPFNDTRFKFILKSQKDFEPNDIDNHTIDLAYLDDGHIFDLQTALFSKLIKQMAPNGIMIVHDTGIHVNEVVDGTCSCDFPNLCGAQHQIDERHFINWIRSNYIEYDIINIHSFIQYRHGLTIIQRKFNLSTEVNDKSKCTYTKQKYNRLSLN